jgi:DNA-binding transcriptional MerR regulator
VRNFDKNIEKKYYSIGEVAAMFKVSTSLLRFWENEFPDIKPKKNKKGVRQYTNEDIEAIRAVYFLVKDKGYTLTGAKDFLKLNTNGEADKAIVIRSLEKIRAFLIELKESLPDENSSNGHPS